MDEVYAGEYDGLTEEARHFQSVCSGHRRKTALQLQEIRKRAPNVISDSSLDLKRGISVLVRRPYINYIQLEGRRTFCGILLRESGQCNPLEQLFGHDRYSLSSVSPSVQESGTSWASGTRAVSRIMQPGSIALCIALQLLCLSTSYTCPCDPAC